MNEYRSEFKEAAKDAKWTFGKVFTFILVGVVIIGFTGHLLGWFGEAAEVAKDEFGPKAALQKYEQFIGWANDIKKMDADVELYEQKVAAAERKYSSYGSDLKDWPAHIQVTYNREILTAQNDLLAIVSQRNNLVKEYNAASDMFHWEPFKEKDDFPGEKFLEYKTRLTE